MRLIICLAFMTFGYAFSQTGIVPVPIISICPSEKLIVGEEFETIIVANGYYDTKVTTSANVSIVKKEGNNLLWIVRPLKKGNCTINIIGLNKEGKEGYLAKFIYEIL